MTSFGNQDHGKGVLERIRHTWKSQVYGRDLGKHSHHTGFVRSAMEHEGDVIMKPRPPGEAQVKTGAEEVSYEAPDGIMGGAITRKRHQRGTNTL